MSSKSQYFNKIHQRPPKVSVVRLTWEEHDFFWQKFQKNQTLAGKFWPFFKNGFQKSDSEKRRRKSEEVTFLNFLLFKIIQLFKITFKRPPSDLTSKRPKIDPSDFFDTKKNLHKNGGTKWAYFWKCHHFFRLFKKPTFSITVLSRRLLKTDNSK